MYVYVTELVVCWGLGCPSTVWDLRALDSRRKEFKNESK